MGDVCLPIFLFLCAVAIIGTIAYFAHLREKERREALSALAASLGWRFNSEKDTSHDDRYGHFPVFKQGHSRYAFNTIMGEMTVEGLIMPVRMGDYHYQVTTSDGKKSNTTTYMFSYVILELPFLGAQDLFIREEGFFDKIAGFIGFDDIDFESAEFSDRFHVKSSDKKFAYDVVNPRMMEFLMDHKPPTFSLEQRSCCLYKSGKRWTPDEFKAMLRWAEQFFEHWPDHLTATFER